MRASLPDLMPGPTGLRYSFDPRSLRVNMDPDSGTVSTEPALGEIPLGQRTRIDLAAYARELTWRNFREKWQQKSRASVNSLGQFTPAGRTGQGLSFQLPSPLPPRIQSLLGPGGPALNVSGSEIIRLSGTSNWTNQQVGLLGQRRSLFPSLNMQQDLDIRLEGQLSDRIKVNLLQQSASPIPLSNRIAINYRGDEDDLVQALDLGNTSLTLPGTQYVSYSGRNEGLFGAKLATRVGPLDFTVLASKQEGRSERGNYAGGSTRQDQSIADLEYVPGVYFFLYDPTVFGTLEVQESSIQIYLDDYNFANNQNSVRGRAFPDPIAGTAAFADSADTVSVRGTFHQLNRGADLDYEVLNEVYGDNFKVIRLRRSVTSEQRLAAAFKARPIDAQGNPIGNFSDYGSTVFVNDADSIPTLNLMLLRPPVSRLVEGPNGFFDPNDVMTKVRDLELKNFYQLAGLNIDPVSFKLEVRQGVEQPPVTVIELNDGTPVPYIELLGLDSIDESNPGQIIFGQHDGLIDGTRDQANQGQGATRVYVDYANGTLFFPDLRPFAPRLQGPNANLFEQAISRNLSRRDSLVGGGGAQNAANPNAYDKYIVRRDLDALYYLDVEFTAARATGEINLGRGNILEGSDVVTINGEVLQRGRDYDIDYDLGRVTLRRQLGPADNLDIDYSYAPLFQSAGRTLLGSAFRWEGRDKAIGGAFMYESKGAQDLRPRLGEEPSRSVIGDLNTSWTFNPDWMTRMVDRLPGVRTTAPSQLQVQAEVGASFPNPNTQNEVFVDDMEGVRDAISLGLTPERWSWSSMPSRNVGGVITPIDTLAKWRNAEIHWYTPPSSVKERDLKPRLTDAQGAQNPRQVLALSVPRRPTTANNDPLDPDSLWVGLTYVLDPVGFDLSRAQFIELWVNDFNDFHAGNKRPRVRGRNVRLNVDIGRVSEDQMRSPDALPNRRLDSEDKPERDNQLTVTSENNEDTGVDALLSHDGSSEEALAVPIRDLITASAADPSGDDFRTVDQSFSELDPRRYWFTNGTENNRTVRPFPDTEDLNLNQNLETQEDYFEFSIDLGDSTHPWLVTDVRREFPEVAADNGWRRYRIPIADSLVTRFGSPNLALTQHIRVWMEGLIDVDPDPSTLLGPEQRPVVLIGGLDIVGSRWQLAQLDTSMQQAGTSVTLNSVNSIDNADVYVPPFDPGRTRSGSQELTRREQSLAIEFTGLMPGDTVQAFKTFSLNEDYTRYSTLSWFAASFQIPAYTPGADSLFYFVRFASDELGLSYYEFKAPVPASSAPLSINWQRLDLALTELSNLKLADGFPTVSPILFQAPGRNPGEVYTVKGRPSFTRLRRVSIGLINANTPGGRAFDSGQLWFNELRATDVDKATGYAQRVLVNGKLANLLAYNLNWNGRDANFITVGQSLGSGNRTDQLSFGASLDLHRFFEGTGVVLPVRYQLSRNTSTPRFTAGDDVIRTGSASEASRTQTETRTWSSSYSRAWSDRSNPFLRYTLGGITSSITRTESDATSPTSLTRSTSIGAAVNYGISLRNLWSFKLPGTQIAVNPLPERAFWNYNVSTVKSVTFDRARDNADSLRERTRVTGRTATVAFGLNSRPVSLLSHGISGTRNLTLGEDLNEKIGFINLGRVVNWRQNFNSRYQLRRGDFLQPTLTWNSTYNQNNGPNLSPDLSVRGINNGQSYALSWALPFDRLKSVRRAPGDTTAPSGPSPWRTILSRLGGITADASYSENSSYTRMRGTPSFLYLVGLSDDPGLNADSTGRVQAVFGNQASRSNDWRTSARTRMLVGFGAFVSTRVEFSSRNSDVNSVKRKTNSSRWPDLDLDYGQLGKTIGLERLLNNPRLRTAYNRSRSTDFVNSPDPTTVSTSSQWQPLLGVSGDLKNGTRAELKVERRVTKRENFQFGSSVTTDRNTDINLSLNRSYSKGQKVNILGKETIVRQTVQLGLTAVFSRRSGETTREGRSGSQLPVEEDRLSVNGNGSYGFSQNVTGSATIGFGQTRDLQRNIIRRNVRVELRAALTF